MKTDFHDRSGKPIYVGDLVQYRLGLNGKSTGPRVMKVVRNKKGVIKLCALSDTNKAGWILRKNYEEYLTIIDTSGRDA